MSEQRAPAVEASALSAGYNGELAIEGLEFRLPHGAHVAVVGPNGAGKTTLFKVIAGIMSPTAGSIRVHGHRPGQHLCVTYVPQRSDVDWAFPVTVSDVVMMGRTQKIGYFRWPREQDRSQVQRALRQVDMKGLAERQIGELSGGQQQRVFLARALAQEPEIVLLDEPLSGLDVPSKRAILEILGRMRQHGVTVLVATHDLNLAAENFEQVMLLNRRLIDFGPPGEVFNRDSLERAYGDGLHIVGQDEGVPIVVDDHVHGDR